MSSSSRRDHRHPGSLFVALVLFSIASFPASAQTDPLLPCRQLSPVSSSPAPTYNSSTVDVQLVVGDHYWACPCGEVRHLVGDNEQRKIVGDSEQRKIVGDGEQRKIIGDNEQRKIVGDAAGLQCRRTPGCAGFTLIGTKIPGIKVVAQSGIRPAEAACIVPY